LKEAPRTLRSQRVDFDIVKAVGLTKLYGPTRALAGVDITLRAGTITSIEGPNGSGKSTLVNILSLIMRPSRGDVRYGELTAKDNAEEIRKRLGLLSHSAMLYPDLTGRENLTLFGSLYALDNIEKRIEDAIARFETKSFLDRPVRTYSRGQTQRIALSRALLHTPRLLLLDEPTTGLDEASQARFVSAVREEKARGAIIVLVTHDDALATSLADVRVRLERGRLAESVIEAKSA
jgi:heme exporter protein A